MILIGIVFSFLKIQIKIKALFSAQLNISDSFCRYSSIYSPSLQSSLYYCTCSNNAPTFNVRALQKGNSRANINIVFDSHSL